MLNRNREGDHSGRFWLREELVAHGTLTLRPDAPPRVSVHPDQESSAGPVVHDVADQTLVGRLYSNEEVTIGDPHVFEWFPGQVFVSGRWAVVGLSVNAVPEGRWKNMRVEASGLEAVLGNAITMTWRPRGGADPRRFSADLNSNAHFESSAHGVSVTATYEWNVSPADPYRFEVTNHPVLKFEAETPMTIDEWVEGWVDPVVGLLSLATGHPEHINRVHLSTPDPSHEDESTKEFAHITGELWGSGIRQVSEPAQRRQHPDGSPVLGLFQLDASPPLATLLDRWRTSLLGETPTSLYRLALDVDLPVQVRYLLCVQALESLDSAAGAASELTEDTEFAQRRQVVVSKLEEAGVDTVALGFAKKYLPNRPFRSLSGRLHRLMHHPSAESQIAAWADRTTDLGQHLDEHGRPSSPLHERLAAARNALSHGELLPAAALRPAVHVVQSLLRGHLLARLGFADELVAAAYDGMDRQL